MTFSQLFFPLINKEPHPMLCLQVQDLVPQVAQSHSSMEMKNGLSFLGKWAPGHKEAQSLLCYLDKRDTRMGNSWTSLCQRPWGRFLEKKCQRLLCFLLHHHHTREWGKNHLWWESQSILVLHEDHNCIFDHSQPVRVRGVFVVVVVVVVVVDVVVVVVVVVVTELKF